MLKFLFLSISLLSLKVEASTMRKLSQKDDSLNSSYSTAHSTTSSQASSIRKNHFILNENTIALVNHAIGKSYGGSGVKAPEIHAVGKHILRLFPVQGNKEPKHQFNADLHKKNQAKILKNMRNKNGILFDNKKIINHVKEEQENQKKIIITNVSQPVRKEIPYQKELTVSKNLDVEKYRPNEQGLMDKFIEVVGDKSNKIASFFKIDGILKN